MNKKGFEMVWSTVVIMVLSLMLLLFIILFFTGSAGNFVEKVKGYFFYSNVDSVIDGCTVLSSSGGNYAFCCEKKTVKYFDGGEKVEGKFSCGDLVDKSFTNGRINDLGCEDIQC